MEKFGIFELLDALSAIALDGEEQKATESEGSAPRSQPPRQDDSAYAPPVYAAYPPPDMQTQKQNENPPKTTGASAIEDFYKRHDSHGKN